MQPSWASPSQLFFNFTGITKSFIASLFTKITEVKGLVCFKANPIVIIIALQKKLSIVPEESFRVASDVLMLLSLQVFNESPVRPVTK